MKKWILIIGLFLLIFFLRYPILKAISNYLVYKNPVPNSIEALFVLSGGSLDRGAEAAKIFKSSKVNKIICTGENYSPDLMVYVNDSVVESTLTKMRILQFGVPDSVIELLKEGTSTIEESEVILEYCLKNGLKKCSILSSNFHTRRIKSSFKKKFKKQNIQLNILGAPSSLFDEKRWWAYEAGLIGVNNEYIKLIMYKIKY